VTRLLAALLLLAGPVALLAGCAGTAPGRPGPTTPGTAADDELQAAQAHDELLRADGDLHAAAAQAAAPDCARIGQLRDNICALAARICQIAGRLPAGSASADLCADGKTRCRTAVDSAQARGCPTKK
jgi:hypothetical protein